MLKLVLLKILLACRVQVYLRFVLVISTNDQSQILSNMLLTGQWPATLIYLMPTSSLVDVRKFISNYPSTACVEPCCIEANNSRVTSNFIQSLASMGPLSDNTNCGLVCHQLVCMHAVLSELYMPSPFDSNVPFAVVTDLKLCEVEMQQ